MLISREHALKENLRHYFTGVACKHGHIVQRFTKTRICTECNRINARKSWSKYPKDELSKLRSNDRVAAWAKRNPALVRAKTREQQAKRLKRVPAWSEREAIKEFYINCPEGYHVDHIYPLQGKTVSGLHVLSNLQYLPAKENRQKGNSF